jgi:hypothetical protein
LKLTRNIYEGGLVGIGNSYINYNSKYLVIDSIKNPSGDSRVGLATFESGVGDYTNPDTKICIPHTNYSLNDDKSVYFFADFTTKGSYFQDGKVNASTWSIGFRINRSLDNIRIPADYKIQAFFVDRYGKVTERVFTSPYLKLSSGTGEVANLSYSTEISNPFFITGTDAHLIIRLISYPRSSNGQEVTEAELNNIQESLLGNTIGTRIKNFYLTISPSPGNSSGLTKLNIVDAAGFTGSTRFYEDLDLVPANSLDSQQFWFYANSETLKAQIIERGKDFIIMGALYSPTWLVNLPKDIEVSVIGGIAFNSDYPSDLKIRTVLDDKATTVEDMVKVAEDQLSNSLHIVYNGETEADSTLTNVIKYIKINDLNNVIGYSGLIAGQNNSQRSILSGEDPIIFTMGSESSSSNYDLIGILTENQSGDGSNVNVSINSDGGLLDYWMRPNYSFSADDFTSALSIASRKITKVDCKVYFLDGLLYIVGIVNPGAILVRKVDLYMTQSESDPPPGFNFLVDGPVDISETIDYIDEYVEYSTQLSGALAVDTRPSIIVTNKGMIFVAYVLEGYNKQILCKILTTGGEQLTDALPILDMSLSNVSSSELEVFCPVLAYDSKLDIIYCAFWCAGKIFLTSLTFNDVCESYTLGLIYLIAGNRDLNNDNNAANSMLRSLQDSGYLIVDQNGDLESDLHRQSVGLVVSNHLDHNNQLIFIYKTSVEKNSEIYSRKFYNDGSVSERILIS